MKTIFNNSELTHVFALQSQTEGQTANRSMFFRNNVIYSYGHHFPMCVIFGDKAILTNRTYSNTTSKHIGLVHSAVSHKEKIWCFNPENAFKGYHKENLNDFVKDIQNELSKVPTARKKSNYLRQAINYALSLRTYVSTFPESEVTLSEMGGGFAHYISESFLTNRELEYRAALEKESAPKEIAPKDPAKQAAKLERIAGKVAEYLAGYCEAWQADNLETFNANFTKEVLKAVRKQAQGGNLSRYYSEYRFAEYLVSQGTKGNVLLRARNGNLETSKGIKIPLPIAERYYKQLKAGTLGEDIAGYKINKGNNTSTDALFGFLFVGCHTLELEHINKFAASQNWI